MYTVSIVASSCELSPRDRIKIKDKGNAKRLDTLTAEGSIFVNIIDWAILKIENDKSADKEYTNYILLDTDGTKYVTGSEAFWSSFRSVYDELSEEIDREHGVGIPFEIYQLPSKNREGKTFLSCSLA